MQNDAAFMMDKCYAKPADESHLHYSIVPEPRLGNEAQPRLASMRSTN